MPDVKPANTTVYFIGGGESAAGIALVGLFGFVAGNRIRRKIEILSVSRRNPSSTASGLTKRTFEPSRHQEHHKTRRIYLPRALREGPGWGLGVVPNASLQARLKTAAVVRTWFFLPQERAITSRDYLRGHCVNRRRRRTYRRTKCSCRESAYG
jgi:hypothetical protein